jgi:hypothetical protein
MIRSEASGVLEAPFPTIIYILGGEPPQRPRALAMLLAARKIRLLNLERSCKSIITQFAREGSPAPGLHLPPAELSRKSN